VVLRRGFAFVLAAPRFYVGVEVTRLIIFFPIRMRLLTSSPTSFSRQAAPHALFQSGRGETVSKLFILELILMVLFGG
jgi:hypothetical protein